MGGSGARVSSGESNRSPVSSPELCVCISEQGKGSRFTQMSGWWISFKMKSLMFHTVRFSTMFAEVVQCVKDKFLNNHKKMQ